MTSVTSNQSIVTNKTKNSFNHNYSNTMPNISYRFDFERFFEHLVDVSLNFTATIDAPQLWLPAGVPGVI